MLLTNPNIGETDTARPNESATPWFFFAATGRLVGIGGCMCRFFIFSGGKFLGRFKRYAFDGPRECSPANIPGRISAPQSDVLATFVLQGHAGGAAAPPEKYCNKGLAVHVASRLLLRNGQALRQAGYIPGPLRV